jgi:protein involved in temperature-dependent protein secretion
VVLAAIKKSVKLATTNPQYRLNLAKGLIVAGDLSGAEQQIQILTRLNFLGHLDFDIQQLNSQISTAHAKADKIKPAPG